MRIYTLIFLVFFLLEVPSVSTAQNAQIGQLEAQFNASRTYERALALGKAYQNQAKWFRQSPQFSLDSAFLYYKKAVDVLETTQPTPYTALAELYCDLSYLSERVSELKNAEAQADKAAFYFQKIGQHGGELTMLEFDILDRQAMCKVHDKPQEALKLIESAWHLLQNDARPAVQAKLLKSKGLFYNLYMGAAENSTLMSYVPTLQKSAALYTSLGASENNESLFYIYQTLMWYYGAMEKLDSCDLYFDKIKQLLPVLNNPMMANRYYSLKGNAFIRRKQYAEAKEQIAESLKLCDKYKLKHTSIYRFNHNLMGYIAMKQRQYDAALAYYTTADSLATRYNHTNKEVFVEHLAQLYEEKGDYAQALAYYKRYSDSAASFKDRASLEQLGKSELKLNVLSQEKELAQKRTEQTIFIAILAISALLMGLLYRNYRLKQKTNQQLANLNGALENVNKDLENKNVLLDKRNAENELLLKEIHHRVKNNLEIVSSLLELQSAQIDDPSVQAAMLTSQNRIHSMGIIHQKLYQSEHLAAIEMRDYFINLGENILSSFNAEGRIKIECNMPQLILDVDTAISIGLITNELLTNSLKYAFENKDHGTIQISLNDENTDGGVLLKISDDGIGKPMEDKAKGTGFGTQLINLLTRQLDGQLTYDVSNGTTVLLAFRKVKLA
jgi:two-component system, sensor histidine kinase PdtaS